MSQSFRKKPVVIQAIQFTGSNCIAVLHFMGGPWENPDLHDTDIPYIHTSEGVMTASKGDWIIRGVKGEYYPCKPDIFEATYEPVVDGPSVVRNWLDGDARRNGVALGVRNASDYMG